MNPQKPLQQTISASYGDQAVALARRGSDNGVLAATFIFFTFASIAYFVVSFFIQASKDSLQGSELAIGLVGTLIGMIMIFGVSLGVGMFVIRIQRQAMLGNSLQVRYSDYAWLRDWTNTVSADLSMPEIEIYITQDPVINAYAFGFARPYCIILNSATIRYLTHEELKAIVIHEMAHIKYGHTIAGVFLAPFLAIPGVNIVASWVSGFWNRRAELTADRLALTYTKKPRLVKEALIKAHVGPDAAKYMNDVAEQWLQVTAERPMNRFAQTFSGHPFLVRRLSQLDKYSYLVDQPKVG